MYSKQELNADSNYVVITSLVKAIRRIRPDWQWVLVFPDDRSEYKYDEDGFFSLPNVFRVPARVSPRKATNAISFDGAWGDALLRKFGFDVCWCNLVEVADKLKMCGTSMYEDCARPVMIAAHNYMIHESLPYPFHSISPIAFQQIAGAYHADHNIFNSLWCEQMFCDTASKWLKPEVIEEIIRERSSLIPYGTLDDSITYTETGNKVPVIAYNHRLQAYKNWRETFALFEELHAEGIPFKVRYLNNTNENVSAIAKLPFVEVHLSKTHDEYLEKLKGCDLNTINSQHETFCISAVESMAYGQPMVAPNTMTFPEITGCKENGYPFLFHTRDEQKAMLIQLLTEPKVRKEWGKKTSEYVRKNFSSALWAQRYVELFERLNGRLALGSPKDVLDFARDELKKSGRLSLRDYYNLIRDRKVNGRIPISNQSFPLTKIARLVKTVGGKTKIIGGEQYVWMD